MRDPVCKSVRVVGATTLSAKTVVTDTTLSGGTYAEAHPRKHARIPPEVYTDAELTATDVRVFSVLAEFERKGLVNVGMRLIGSTIHVDAANVSRSMARLVKRGHISKSTVSTGQRQSYRLLSPIFKKSMNVDVSTPVVDHACAKCNATGRKLDKACHCGPCAKKLRGVHPKQFEAIGARVDRQMERLVSQPRKKAS